MQVEFHAKWIIIGNVKIVNQLKNKQVYIYIAGILEWCGKHACLCPPYIVKKKEKETLDHLADGVDDVSQYKTLSAPYICVWSVLIFNL